MDQAEQRRGDVTELLLAYRDGDREAFDRLVPLVYDDLHRIARRHMRRVGGGTIGTTGLVHEAYLKMVDQGRVDWQDRGHFLAVSAHAMRQVLVDYARKRNAAKRGGGAAVVTLEEDRIAVEDQVADVLALDQALERLAEHDERLARTVECRVFGGLSEQETADALGVSLRTAQRDWRRARAWLKTSLEEA